MSLKKGDQLKLTPLDDGMIYEIMNDPTAYVDENNEERDLLFVALKAVEAS